MAEIQELDRLKIPLQDIIQATNNFAEDNLIGMGGFGRVYKGQLRHATSFDEPSSTTVAVKRLDKIAIYGQGQREFIMEIIMLASYKHSNLVSLVGFSEDAKEKILVYKYETNGSLDKHLASTNLTWVQRLKICLGAARGLEFLHYGVALSHRVIHRDIKSANILLDENWEAKISDFGLSKIGPMNQEFTFLATNAVGTFGYVDPVYQKTGVLSKESDVYSFGVVLFEVVCGRFAMSAEYQDERKFLSNFVKLEGKFQETIMENLREQIKPYSLQTFSRIAYACLNESRNERPLMTQVVQELQSSFEYQIGSATTLWGSSIGGNPWSFLFSSDMKLKKIKIDHDDWIFSIGFTVEDLSGSIISCDYGGSFGGDYGRPSGGKVSEICFDTDEDIIEILGTVGITTEHYASVAVIASLCIVTNKREHERFGKETGNGFSFSWEAAGSSFAGFYGRAGAYIDGLGFYSKVNAV